VNTRTIPYWIATLFIGLETLVGGITDLARGRAALVSGPFVTDLVGQLGYPVYVLTIIGVWKVLGAIVLFLPGLPRLKEWAYAGIVFELTGASASHYLHGNSAVDILTPLAMAVVAIASWAFRPPSRTLGALFPTHAWQVIKTRVNHEPDRHWSSANRSGRRAGGRRTMGRTGPERREPDRR
jgi:uncharacterized membrane protein YphA (DoxX/SURF4 family)